MPHRPPDLLPDAEVLPGLEDVVVRGDDHKHVVNANAEADEGQNGVHGRVGEAEEGAEAHGDDHSHRDTEEPGQGEVEPHVDEVHPAEHHDCVEEHDDVAPGHVERVKEDRLPAHVSEALGGIGQHGGGRGGAVEADLYELLLPAKRRLVGQLELEAGALVVHHLHIIRDLQPPEDLSHPGPRDVTRGVPGDAAQDLGVVVAVAIPGTLVQVVHGVEDLLLGCAHDQLLVISPHF